MVDLLKRLLTHKKGNVAVMAAVSLIPVVGAIGGAVDIARRNAAAATIQKAADSAALHGATILVNQQGNAEEANRRAQEIFELNTVEVSDLVDGTLNVDPDLGGFRVSFEGTSHNLFVSFFQPTFSINQTAVASAGLGEVTTPTELVIVLDTTKSLGFNNARDTVDREIRNLLQDSYGEDGTNDRLLTTIVPFSDRVNVGTQNAQWVQGNTNGWSGCVLPRHEPTGNTPFRLTDKPANGSRRFLPTGATESVTLTPEQQSLSFRNVVNCANDPILGPVTTLDPLESFINSYELTGSGRQDVGLAWGWRYLSPQWRGEFGIIDYPSKKNERRKVALLINDGRSRTFCHEATTHIDGNGNATVPPEHGSRCENEITNDGFDNIASTCEAMKDEGIEIFVLYINGIARGEPTMRDCATDGFFFESENVASLTEAFSQITQALGSKGVVLVE